MRFTKQPQSGFVSISGPRGVGRLLGQSTPLIKETLGYATPIAAMAGSVARLDDRFAQNKVLEHAPAMVPSFAIGVGGGFLINYLTNQLRSGEHTRLAAATERAGRVITCIGSVAYQLMTETPHLNSVAHVALGAAAALPGIWVAESVIAHVQNEDVAYQAAEICAQAGSGLPS